MLQFLTIYNKVIDFLEGNMFKCYTKQLTGHDCPGCGMQRSIVHLLKGEFVEAFHMYPPLYPLMITIALLSVRIFSKSSWSLIGLKYAYITSAVFIVVNFLSKLI